MATLKSVPPPVGSRDELMAVARALEQEAARRYRELAARMRLRREERVALLFDFLASVEDKHAEAAAMSMIEADEPAIVPERVAWDMPESFDEEEGSSHLLTPYRALAVAVRNEERAFAFYSYVAAEAPDDAARQLAEELARDELAHAFLLRRERRKAYHKETIKRPSAALPKSVDELRRLCAETEWRAAGYHRALAEALPMRGENATAFVEAASDEEACAREAAVRAGAQLDRDAVDSFPTVGGGLRLLEEAFDRYADIAERSRDEAVMHEAQALAARAVRRLGAVQRLLGNAQPDHSAPGGG